MWFAAPEVNESDAILADQLRTYERQIEDCELATPISHWDGAQSGCLAGVRHCRHWVLAVGIDVTSRR